MYNSDSTSLCVILCSPPSVTIQPITVSLTIFPKLCLLFLWLIHSKLEACISHPPSPIFPILSSPLSSVTISLFPVFIVWFCFSSAIHLFCLKREMLKFYYPFIIYNKLLHISEKKVSLEFPFYKRSGPGGHSEYRKVLSFVSYFKLVQGYSLKKKKLPGSACSF